MSTKTKLSLKDLKELKKLLSGKRRKRKSNKTKVLIDPRTGQIIGGLKSSSDHMQGSVNYGPTRPIQMNGQHTIVKESDNQNKSNDNQKLLLDYIKQSNDNTAKQFQLINDSFAQHSNLTDSLVNRFSDSNQQLFSQFSQFNQKNVTNNHFYDQRIANIESGLTNANQKIDNVANKVETMSQAGSVFGDDDGSYYDRGEDNHPQLPPPYDDDGGNFGTTGGSETFTNVSITQPDHEQTDNDKYKENYKPVVRDLLTAIKLTNQLNNSNQTFKPSNNLFIETPVVETPVVETPVVEPVVETAVKSPVDDNKMYNVYDTYSSRVPMTNNPLYVPKKTKMPPIQDDGDDQQSLLSPTKSKFINNLIDKNILSPDQIPAEHKTNVILSPKQIFADEPTELFEPPKKEAPIDNNDRIHELNKAVNIIDLWILAEKLGMTQEEFDEQKSFDGRKDYLKSFMIQKHYNFDGETPGEIKLNEHVKSPQKKVAFVDETIKNTQVNGGSLIDRFNKLSGNNQVNELAKELGIKDDAFYKETNYAKKKKHIAEVMKNQGYDVKNAPINPYGRGGKGKK